MWGRIQLIFRHVKPKIITEIISSDRDSIISMNSSRWLSISIFSLVNIATKDITHAVIKVAPAARSFEMILCRMSLLFNALIIPLEFPPAELKIEIVARTNPNKIPETVEITPAAARMSLCCINGTIFNKKYVNITLPIKEPIYFNNICHAFLLLISYCLRYASLSILAEIIACNTSLSVP